MSTDLVDTTEMYLKAVYELEEEGIRPIRARLVERLDQSKPTVSETVARMERDGLVALDGARTIRLTPVGRREATEVMRKHRLAERLLLDVVGLPWDQVHDEACRWEHVMSRAVEERLALLVKTGVDPYGNPIPAADSAGPGAQAARAMQLDSVRGFLKRTPDGGEATLARIGEVLQTDGHILRALAAAGVIPGARIEIRSDGDVVTLCVREGDAYHSEGVRIGDWMTAHLFVHA
ncbi:metal-dependent transcriptional regulator [Neoactinobaculum massilliense]|uniref:metal-dependent transcriptional regulator n=1 Tax=Neoactinobaculum massilliense TaxID=2364794 RepID=UPI000F543184|nr:metal-dependent transcriptional regulator [Neoactinobaculum massilliense]